MNLMTEEEFLTPGEVAKRLRLTEASILRLLREKKLPGIKVSGSWRIDRQEFENYLDNLKKQQQQ